MGGRQVQRKSDCSPAAATMTAGKPGQDDGLRSIETLLFRGFCTSSGYGNMSRERAFVELNDGVSTAQLLEFCRRHLNNEPLPDLKDPLNGSTLMAIFKAAEGAGLVKLKIVAPQSFVPEMGSRSPG